MIGTERAFPNSWSGRESFGYTKREDMVIKLASGIVAGLYGYKGDLNKMTETQIVAQAIKLADEIVARV